jgi:predicted RNA-binding Zn ribbon-like protein
MAIQLNFPNVWTVGDAVRAIRSAASMVVALKQQNVKSEALALITADIRSFAKRSLVGRVRGSLLSPVDTNVFNKLLLRTVRVTTQAAAGAGKRQPSVATLQRGLVVAVRTEQRLVRQGMAGAEPAVFVLR